MKAFLNRLTDDGKQTLGVLTVYRGVNKIFECKTLEPPWCENKRNQSCIPNGRYPVSIRVSPKFGTHFLIGSTSPREFVLIHTGNFVSHTTGCILVGRDFGDLNRDGTLDLVASRITLDMLLQAVGDNPFTLTIGS